MPKSLAATEPCPCGTGRTYGECCGPLHEGKKFADTAEALMRSRYAAYALRLTAYVRDTWHPRTRPSDLDLEEDETVWTGLEVRRHEIHGKSRAIVEFIAKHKVPGSRAFDRIHEVSNFVREKNRWFYVDGKHL